VQMIFKLVPYLQIVSPDIRVLLGIGIAFIVLSVKFLFFFEKNTFFASIFHVNQILKIYEKS
jgi:multisubunit Na+/H+ antiporter MnhB subunit